MNLCALISLAGTRADAVTKALDEKGQGNFPGDCLWPMDQALSADFFPA